MKKEISITEYTSRSTCAVAVCRNNDYDCSNPICWGSGFIIEYKKRIFFVTADHVIHYEDYVESKRVAVNGNVFLLTNKVKKNEFKFLVVGVAPIYYFDKKVIGDDARQLLDCAICLLSKKIINPLISKKIKDENGVDLLSKGNCKILISSDVIDIPSKNRKYLVSGEINHQISGVFLKSNLVSHQSISFSKEEQDFYTFHTPSVISLSNWKGLSGAPFFDDKGSVVGMLTDVKVGYHIIHVLPFNRIIPLLECVIANES